MLSVGRIMRRPHYLKATTEVPRSKAPDLPVRSDTVTATALRQWRHDTAVPDGEQAEPDRLKQRRRGHAVAEFR